MADTYRTFWLVWNEGGGAPKKHTSLESAEQESERMALAHPGCVFHVLESVAACKKSDVQWKQADPDYLGDEVPF